MKKLKKIIATAAVLAALFVQPARSQDKDSNLYLNGFYQDSKYELNLGTQLRFDDLSPYADIKLDNISQNYGLGLKLKGIGEAVGGISNSSSQKLNVSQSAYNNTSTILHGTSTDSGTISETENLDEKISGSRGGAELNMFGVKVQYLNSSQTTTSKINISNLTNDNYQENTSEVQGPATINIETKVATGVQSDIEVNTETKAVQNSVGIQFNIADILFPSWTYNLSSINNKINTVTKVDSTTTGYTQIVINNGVPTIIPISSTSSTNSTNSQDVNQENKSNLFSLRANFKTESFNPSGKINYNDSTRQIDGSITSITKFLCGERASFSSQNGKQSYILEISDGKGVYNNFVDLEEKLIEVDDSIINSNSRKLLLTEMLENDSLLKRNWRFKIGSVDSNLFAEVYLKPLALGYDNQNQKISAKCVLENLTADISYSISDKRLGGGIKYLFK